MTWFQRDHTNRQLSRRERDFLEALVALLVEARPAQLDEAETALTAEGTDCLIVLMPHRALGGVAVVVWLLNDRATVTWAQVGGLGCCHDALDAGVSVAHFRLDPVRPDFRPVLNSIREQFTIPIVLKVYGTARATVHVRDDKGILRTIGEIGESETRLGWFRRRRRREPTHETEVRLADPTLPPLTEPSGVDDWFKTTRHGA